MFFWGFISGFSTGPRATINHFYQACPQGVENRNFLFTTELFVVWLLICGIFPQTFPQSVENFLLLQPRICHIPGFPQGRIRHFSDKSTTFSIIIFVILSKMGIFLDPPGHIYVIYVKKTSVKSFPHDFSTGCGKPLWISFGDNSKNPLTYNNIFKRNTIYQQKTILWSS